MGFSRQEYWSGLPLPSPGDLPEPRDWTYISCLAGSFFSTFLLILQSWDAHFSWNTCKQNSWGINLCSYLQDSLPDMSRCGLFGVSVMVKSDGGWSSDYMAPTSQCFLRLLLAGASHPTSAGESASLDSLPHLFSSIMDEQFLWKPPSSHPLKNKVLILVYLWLIHVEV